MPDNTECYKLEIEALVQKNIGCLTKADIISENTGMTVKLNLTDFLRIEIKSRIMCIQKLCSAEF